MTSIDSKISVALIYFLAAEHERRRLRDIVRLQAWNKSHPESAKLRQQRYRKTGKAKERLARYAIKHPNRIKDAQSRYNKSEKSKIRHQRYHAKNPLALIEKQRKYRASHPEKMRSIWRAAGKRRYSSERGRMIVHARSRIRAAIVSQGVKMPASASTLIGCSWDTLKSHLESLFLPGMNWLNYGREWHVDHIKPIASFDLCVAEQRESCFSYKNLQPLWKNDNLRKGARLDYITA